MSIFTYMLTNEYKVIGVMSGTSLDGIDLAYISFTKNHSWKFKIHNSKTIEYDEKWRLILAKLTEQTISNINIIDFEYTKYLSSVINNFIEEFNIKEIDAICSHGHTALHQPKDLITLQIGNLPIISKLLNHLVVCDFRIQDVIYGGQGAPLVPIGDHYLFSDYDFCLNLGGFANISTIIENERIAYDICPVNVILNYYVKQLGYSYDDGGKIASRGSVNFELLNELNSLEFYKLSYPKSLGLEWVIKNVIPLIDNFSLKIESVLNTIIEHIAIQITNEINRKINSTILVTGGGTYNTYLMDRIKNLTNNKIIIPSNEVIEFKEALIFGFLGVLKLRNEVNCLKSVTGASKDHSTGNIYYP